MKYLPLKALHYTKIISRKALHSVLLHKNEITYRDTGVSKKIHAHNNKQLDNV